ncbi:MAG: radical SAM protein [Anaerolineae bacterium]|nr:radical SAM protein [Anaerolineae bacterium]
MQSSLVYGPVPSRRLGRSLGVNNIPPKVCTYACVYCQLGGSNAAAPRRSPFYRPADIAEAAAERLAEARERGEAADYVTLVPDGEPTLDVNLGQVIAALTDLGSPVAVISNASLIWQPEVREALCQADWVSLKADAADEPTWQRVNRPHADLQLERVQEGMLAFRRQFRGTLATETMLVSGVNDAEAQVQDVAAFLEELEPDISYISIPTRPPALGWVNAAPEESLHYAYQAFTERGLRTELLIGYEGDAFAASGDAEADLLSVTAVHPMREEAVAELLRRDGAGWEVLEGLIRERKLVGLDYGGHRFYMRRLPGRREP